MRNESWKRVWFAGLIGGLTISAALGAGDDTPPPYPSVSPVLSAASPLLLSNPGEDVKPAVGQLPSLPSPIVPKLEMPVFPTVKNDDPVPPRTLMPVAEIKPLTPLATVVAGATVPKATAPKSASSVNITLGTTPGVLDNGGKLDAMLVETKLAYAKVHDYSCHFIKQERLKGKLTAEVIHELHARTMPFAVYTKAVQPKEAAGFESVYVAGRFAMNQVRVKSNGGVFTTVSVDDSRAMSGRHPADQVGIGAVIAMIDKQIATERKLGNPTTVAIRDFTYANKPVTRYELFCDKPHAHRYSHRTVLFIDKETKLPVRFEAYDEPRGGGGPTGDLLESYSFVNLKLNVGHATAVFDR